MYDLKSATHGEIARIISRIENEEPGYEKILHSLSPDNSVPVIGITGPPGAGKSTLINAILKILLADEKNRLKNKGAAVIAVDPTSPFTRGALLGDRLRMSEHFNHPKIFIRSLATRGSLGGLSYKTMEISDLLRSSGFDFIFIETVGVGQAEVEIVSMADVTVLVLVPESGDDVQSIKAGIMEAADIFVINKSDREGADKLGGFIQSAAHLNPETSHDVPVINTVASQQKGISELLDTILKVRPALTSSKKTKLLLEKAVHIIRDYKMKSIDKNKLQKQLNTAIEQNGFNIYAFANKFINESAG